MARELTPWLIKRPRRGKAWTRSGARRTRLGFEGLESRFLLSRGLGLDPESSSGLARNLGAGRTAIVDERVSATSDDPAAQSEPEAQGSESASVLDPTGGEVSTAVETANRVGSRTCSLNWFVEYLDDEARLPSEDPEEVSLLDEVEGPHPTAETAQDLPASNAIRVRGTLDPSDQLDLYRMPLPAGFRSVRIDLNVANPTPEALEHLVLFDQNGQVIDTQAVNPQSGQIILILRQSVPLCSDSLFIGIYRPGTSESPSTGAEDEPEPFPMDGDQDTAPIRSTVPASSYELIFSTEPDPLGGATQPERPGTDEGSQAPASGSDGTESSFSPPSTARLVPTIVDRPSRSGDATIQIVVGRDEQASRPSPLRSSAPRAGIFTTGPATRPVDRRMAAVVDMALIDLPSRPSSAISPNRPDSSELSGDGELIDIPLSYLGGPRLDGGPATARRSTTDFAPLVWELQNQRAAPSRFQATVSQKPVGHHSSTDHGDAHRGHLVGAQVALRAGLTLAYGLAFTFLLPDLTTRFQTLRHHPRPRIRKRWLRRFFGV